MDTRIKAYLIEDQADVRDMLIEGIEEIAPLEFVGYGESEVDARCWMAAHEGGWDLLIVDLFLRHGSGFGVLRHSRRRAPRQKVVVLTSYLDDKVLARCKELGADAVFDKGQEVDKLVRFCIEQAIEVEAMSPTGLITESQPIPLDDDYMSTQASTLWPDEVAAGKKAPAKGGKASRPGSRQGLSEPPEAWLSQYDPSGFSADSVGPSGHAKNDGLPDHLAARNEALKIEPLHVERQVSLARTPGVAIVPPPNAVLGPAVFAPNPKPAPQPAKTSPVHRLGRWLIPGSVASLVRRKDKER